MMVPLLIEPLFLLCKSSLHDLNILKSADVSLGFKVEISWSSSSIYYTLSFLSCRSIIEGNVLQIQS